MVACDVFDRVDLVEVELSVDVEVDDVDSVSLSMAPDVGTGNEESAVEFVRVFFRSGFLTGVCKVSSEW